MLEKAKKYCLKAHKEMKLLPEEEIEEIESEMGVQGIFGREGELRFIAFAGSNEFKDWKINLNFFLTNNYSRGVAKAYHSLRHTLWEKVFNLPLNVPSFKERLSQIIALQDYTLLLTGYSLGGGIATFAALDLAKHGFKVNVVTFGELRTIKKKPLKNPEFASYVRVINPFDPVPYCPFWLTHFDSSVVRRFWWGNPHDLISY